MAKKKSNKPVVAVSVAQNNFPFWEKCARELVKWVDYIYVRFDGPTGDPEIYRDLKRVYGKKLRACMIVEHGWHFPDWREECVGMVHEDRDGIKPDIYAWVDSDEIMGDGFEEELMDF